MAIIEHPTYLEHIRSFFDLGDIACMRTRRNVQLGTYEGVKFHALQIYFRTKDGTMPPQAARRWSKDKVETFYNWMRDGYPRGEARISAMDTGAPTASRIRKDVASLKKDEIKTLKKAFKGMMDRDLDDPESYFAIAGLHWLPGPKLYCRHHENGYNPWHRLYLQCFEDAMRTVPGCENVTLPYWDITASEIPKLLYEEPFAKYDLPRELCRLAGDCYEIGYQAGYPKNRNSRSTIVSNVLSGDIANIINKAVGQCYWERFNGWDAGRTQDGIILAHDIGHGACGTAIGNQDIAAFDPMFWFFHANWDRLWWKWQKAFKATSLDAFKTHLAGSADWLEDPIINKLPPFDKTTAETISLSDFDVDYAPPKQKEVRLDATAQMHGSILASREFRVDRRQLASVRIKGVNRLNIPGTFDVTLRARGKVLGIQSFFQSTEPRQCPTCRRNEIVNFDFVVPQEDLVKGRIQVEVHLHQTNGKKSELSLSAVGDPTINARLLLEE